MSLMSSAEWATSKSEGHILDSILEVEDLFSTVARARNLGSLFTQLVPRKSAKSGKKPAELLLEALASLHKALTIVQILMLRHLDEQLVQKDRAVLLVADRERVDLPELDLARRLTGLRVMHARSAQAARDQASGLV